MPADPATTAHLMQEAEEEQATHYDAYTAELGPGEPLYPTTVLVEELDEGGRVTQTGTATTHSVSAPKRPSRSSTPARHRTRHSNSNAGSLAEAVATAKGFRDPAGKPAGHELWRFRRRGCQDCWAAVFFVGLVSLVMLWGVLQVWHMRLSQKMLDRIDDNVYGGGDKHLKEMATMGAVVGPSQQQQQQQSFIQGPAAVIIGAGALYRTPALFFTFTPYLLLAALVTLSVLAGLLAFSLLEQVPRQLITLQCWVQAGTLSVMGLYIGLAGQYTGATVLFLLAGVTLLWLYLIQDRIPFSAALLAVAARIVRRHKGLLFLALGLALVVIGYTLLCLALLLPAMIRLAASEPWDSDGYYVLLVCFSVFWVEQVMTNIMHVTAAGVVATWYFAGESGLPLQSPVRAAFTRATTTSFGSICLGSLLVASIRFVRYLVQAAQDENGGGFLSYVGMCLLACLEAVVRYFNEYAFVHVAIYGCSYVEAAQRTWQLTKQSFFAAIFNDCLVGQAIDLLTLFTALVLGLVLGLLSWSLGIGLLGFMFGTFVCATMLQVAQSAVMTIFVCFAEVPAGLRISFPEVYEELVRTDAGLTHNNLSRNDNEAHGQYGSV